MTSLKFHTIKSISFRVVQNFVSIEARLNFGNYKEGFFIFVFFFCTCMMQVPVTSYQAVIGG